MGQWQGLTAPSDALGAEPAAPADRTMARGSPLQSLKLRVHNVLYCTKAGTGSLNIRTLTAGCSQVPEGPVEPCTMEAVYRSHATAEQQLLEMLQPAGSASESAAMTITHTSQGKTLDGRARCLQ